MNRNRSILAVLILMMFATVACSSLNQLTPSELDDNAIEAEIRARLLDDVDLKAFAISVKVNNGNVSISGDVDTQDQRNRIGETARKVDGVKSVINNVRVR